MCWGESVFFVGIFVDVLFVRELLEEGILVMVREDIGRENLEEILSFLGDIVF